LYEYLDKSIDKLFKTSSIDNKQKWSVLEKNINGCLSFSTAFGEQWAAKNIAICAAPALLGLATIGVKCPSDGL
jgi:hypothetical protein